MSPWLHCNGIYKLYFDVGKVQKMGYHLCTFNFCEFSEATFFYFYIVIDHFMVPLNFVGFS